MGSLLAIQAWLQQPDDYAAGLTLLRPHCRNLFLLQLLEKGQDRYNAKKLQAELQQLEVHLQQAAEEQPVPQPEVLQQEQGEARRLMDERTEAKARLRFLMDDEQAQPERKTLAFRIIGITRRLDAIYQAAAFYKEHGYLPDGKLDVGDDPVELKKRQLTLRTYVTRYTTLTEKAEGATRIRHQTKLRNYSGELAIINKKLEALN